MFQVNEEEIQLDDGSEEMSVAIDLAKLSQGHFSHNDFKQSGYVFYTEDGRQASSLEDLNGQTVEVAEAPRYAFNYLFNKNQILFNKGQVLKIILIKSQIKISVKYCR